MNVYSVNGGAWYIAANSMPEAALVAERRVLERERELDEFFGDGRPGRPRRLVINSIHKKGEVLIAEPEVIQWPPY